jgi:hypothetical protein
MTQESSKPSCGDLYQLDQARHRNWLLQVHTIASWLGPVHCQAVPTSNPWSLWLQVHNLSTISLIEGQSYYVTVMAWNGAGPPLSVNTSSQPVLVDTTGPTAGTLYNT